jgi:hypothetical protein
MFQLRFDCPRHPFFAVLTFYRYLVRELQGQGIHPVNGGLGREETAGKQDGRCGWVERTSALRRESGVLEGLDGVGRDWGHRRNREGMRDVGSQVGRVVEGNAWLRNVDVHMCIIGHIGLHFGRMDCIESSHFGRSCSLGRCWPSEIDHEDGHRVGGGRGEGEGLTNKTTGGAAS